MTLYVDTSAFVAAVDSGDRNHQRARSVLSDEALVTSDHVLVETWTFLTRRLGYGVAERFLTDQRRARVRVELVGEADLEIALAIGRQFEDQEFSIFDRTSFAVMERLGLTRVAAFDHHFAVYRYGRNRDRAFEIVR